MVILASPLGRKLISDARAKSEASLRRHTFVRYSTRVLKFERLSLNFARFPTTQESKREYPSTDAGV
jgi:hypothetical protein